MSLGQNVTHPRYQGQYLYPVKYQIARKDKDDPGSENEVVVVIASAVRVMIHLIYFTSSFQYFRTSSDFIFKLSGVMILFLPLILLVAGHNVVKAEKKCVR